MEDEEKNTEELLNELKEAGKRIAALEGLKDKYIELEKTLNYRLKIEELISYISNRFINLSTSHIDEEIKNTLKLIGEFASVDRCLIAVFSENLEKISKIYEWTPPGVAPRAEIFYNMPLQKFLWFGEKFEKTEHVYIPDTSHLPPGAVMEKSIFEKFGIRTLLIIPMVYGEKLTGMLAFSSLHETKSWREEDIRLFKVAAGLFVSILEKKKWEEALRESEKRFRAIFESARDCIFIKSNELRYTHVNPRLEELFETPASQIIGMTDDELFGEDGGKHIREIDLKVLSGEIVSEEDRKPVKGEERVFNVIKVPLKDDEGNIAGLCGIARDITDRKRAEEGRMELEEQLRQVQKMEALGTLAGGIAHDFNNILGAVMGYTEMTLDELPENSIEQKNLVGVLQACIRAKSLVRQIMVFSRQTKEDKKMLRPGDIVREVLKLLKSILPSTIEIKRNIKSKSSVILADGSQIHQILMNLCTNSAQAMEEKGGILEVILQDVELSRQLAAIHAGLEPGPYVKLTVKDSGHGMERKILSRIFEPYFTTKEPGSGTGLGLAVVHGIVKNHNGFISVESDPGKGTSFHIFLPRIEVGDVKDEVISLNIPGGSESILFVDDEKPLVDIGEQILRKLGYNVIAKTGSKQALSAFQDNPAGFDLMITDYTMPKMTGLDLAKEVLKIRPDFPVILCSGFTETVNEEIAREAGLKAFIVKPLSKSKIGTVVRRVLDGKA